MCRLNLIIKALHVTCWIPLHQNVFTSNAMIPESEKKQFLHPSYDFSCLQHIIHQKLFQCSPYTDAGTSHGCRSASAVTPAL